MFKNTNHRVFSKCRRNTQRCDEQLNFLMNVRFCSIWPTAVENIANFTERTKKKKTPAGGSDFHRRISVVIVSGFTNPVVAQLKEIALPAAGHDARKVAVVVSIYTYK